MVEEANFQSACILANGQGRTAVIWRNFIVSFYLSADDYVNQNTESFMTFLGDSSDFAAAYSAAYFWADLDTMVELECTDEIMEILITSGSEDK